MLTRERLSTYAAFDGSLNRPVRFDNPDDQLAFIEANAEDLWSGACKGFAIHGRGVVIMQQRSPAFIESRYATPEPGDLDGLVATATEDFEGYDPTSQMLVGIDDPEGRFLGFWKMERR